MMMKNHSQDNALAISHNFEFEVDFGTELNGVLFEEVIGLESAKKVIQDAHTNSKVFSINPMPGLARFSSVIMRNGIFLGVTPLLYWMDDIRMNTPRCFDITIRKISDAGQDIVYWELKNAWPINFTCLDWQVMGETILLEKIEFAFEAVSFGKSNVYA